MGSVIAQFVSRNRLNAWRAMARLRDSIFTNPHSSQNGRRGRVYSLFSPCSEGSTDSTEAQTSAESAPARIAKLFARRLCEISANDRLAVGEGGHPPSIIAGTNTGMGGAAPG
jgi:hypothetical protein